MSTTHRSHEEWRRRADAVVPRAELFIGGAYRPAAAGGTFDATSPRDGRRLAAVSAGQAEDVGAAVRSARAAFDGGAWSRCDPRQRKRVLLRLAELILERREDLALLESLDVGKPISDALAVDVPGCARTFQWYAEAIDKTYDEVAPAPARALALVTREPLGVVGAVVPWNYPLLITSWKLAPALATGNSVVLKPAEQSSLSSLLLAELAAEAGLPDGVLNVVTGLGPEAGAALGLHPDVDKVAFTGSPEVGRMFLRYAADSNAKQVALELGGKSPQLVLGDVEDLAAAASAVAWGIFYNAGQTCNAGSRLLVDETVHEALLDQVAAVTKNLQVGDPLDPATQIGALVDESQLRRVGGFVDAARAGDAVVTLGGSRVLEETGGTFYAPTIVDRVSNDDPLAQEEVFGPVLAAVTFRGVEEGVRLANATRYGLAASVWTRHLGTAHHVARRLRAGTVWVNTFDASDVITPFGGFKDSGSGRDKSLHALDAYTSLKTTWIDLGQDSLDRRPL